MSEETDALFFALALLVFLTGIVAAAVEVVVVPFIVEARERGEEAAGAFVWSALGLCAGALGVIGLVSLVAAGPVLRALSGFSSASLDEIYRFLLTASPVFPLVGASSVLTGTLNAYRAFRTPAALLTVEVAVLLLVAYASKGALGVSALALGFVVGEGVRFLGLWYAIRGIGLRIASVWPRNADTFVKFTRTASFQVLAMGLAGLPPLINRTFASYAGVGAVSVVEFAEKMFYVPAGLLGSGFLVVLLSHWSSTLHNNGPSRLWHEVLRTTKIIFWLSLVGGITCFVLRFPLASLALGWGNVPGARTAEVANLFGIYLLGLVPNTVGLVLVRGHLVLRNTAMLLKVAVFAVAILLALNSLLLPSLGLAGIALATTVSHIGVGGLLFASLYSLMLKRRVS